MKNDKKPHIKQDTKYRRKHSRDKYGVIGVCGVVGNMVARVLVDNGLKVRGTDILGENECTFQYTLHDYPIHLFLGGHPESFFENIDYIIPPPSLSINSNFYKNLSERVKAGNFKIKSVDDVLNMITPEKPVLCITGTNGKTTTTSLLKHICSQAGLKPTEHGFNELQGNIDYIPPLQCRLKGDVSVLETGTFGNPGDLKFIIERCQPSCGIITNITPDHLDEDQNFLNYAHIKGELVDHLQDKMLIINSDDPTVMGLIKDKDISLDLITFGVDYKTGNISKKPCLCRKEVTINETISGMGYYNCSCGLERPNPDYIATEITKKSFNLHTPNDVCKVEMQLMGLHNVYNALAAIAAAKEYFKIPLDDIIAAIKNFRGVPGRMDYIGQWDDKKVLIDYAHNPGGVGTILGELKKIYESIAVVITVSSESGEEGDDLILNKSLKLADYIIPASFYARKAADKFIENAKGSDEKKLSEKIILTSEYPHEFKKGTLGANSDQLINGLLKAVQYDVSAVVCIGEAAFKYKENIHIIINNRKRQS
jgi:UDP-N-acetylmuramate--alanine ligase